MKKAEDNLLQSTTEIRHTNNKGNAQQLKSNFMGLNLLLPEICADESIPANTGLNCASEQPCSPTSPTKPMEKTTAVASGICFLFARYPD